MKTPPDTSDTDTPENTDAPENAATTEIAGTHPRPHLPNWLADTMPLCAGMSCWHLFWHEVSDGGTLSHGAAFALGMLALAAAASFVLFFFFPARLGAHSRHSFDVLGARIFGQRKGGATASAIAGLIFFTLLVRGVHDASRWLALAFRKAETLREIDAATNSPEHWAITAVWLAGAFFVATRWRTFAGRIALVLLVLPALILGVLLSKTLGGVHAFTPQAFASATPLWGNASLGIFNVLLSHVATFAAIIGIGVCALGTHDKTATAPTSAKGSVVGVLLAMVCTGAGALLITAGAQVNRQVSAIPSLAGNTDPLNTTLLRGLLDNDFYPTFTVLLALSAIPATCFLVLAGIGFFKVSLRKKTRPSAFGRYEIALNDEADAPVIIYAAVDYGALAAVTASAIAGVACAFVPVETVFAAAGVALAPMCAVLTAVRLRCGSELQNARPAAGWLAWAGGAATGGIALAAAPAATATPCPPLLAFLAAFALYLLARRRPDPPGISDTTK